MRVAVHREEDVGTHLGALSVIREPLGGRVWDACTSALPDQPTVLSASVNSLSVSDAVLPLRDVMKRYLRSGGGRVSERDAVFPRETPLSLS